MFLCVPKRIWNGRIILVYIWTVETQVLCCSLPEFKLFFKKSCHNTLSPVVLSLGCVLSMFLTLGSIPASAFLYERRPYKKECTCKPWWHLCLPNIKNHEPFHCTKDNATPDWFMHICCIRHHCHCCNQRYTWQVSIVLMLVLLSSNGITGEVKFIQMRHD